MRSRATRHDPAGHPLIALLSLGPAARVAGVQTQSVHPRDEAAFARWFAVYATANEEVWPGEPGWSMREQRERALHQRQTHREVHLLAESDSEPVGAGLASLPLRDNRHFAELEVVVPPAHRRAGTGSALLARLEQLAAADNRTVLAADSQSRADAPTVAPGVPFAQAHGYRPAQRSYRRTLALPGDSARLDSLEAQCAPHAAGYRLTPTRGCPAVGRSARADGPAATRSPAPPPWVRRRRSAAIARRAARSPPTGRGQARAAGRCWRR